MTRREAVKVLMQSPFYFKLDLKARKTLVEEFRAIHGSRHPAPVRPTAT